MLLNLNEPKGIVSRLTPIIDTKIERQIITGLIISDQFCYSIKSMWREDAFVNSYSRIIGRWCQEYFSKYNKAPGRHIEHLFLNNQSSISPSEVDIIAEFLSSISDEYEKSETWNFEYCIDEAEKYFQLSSMNNFQTDFKNMLAQGRVQEAQSLITNYVRPSRPLNKGGNPVKDLDNILNAFKTREVNTLIRLPGELGKMVPPLCRGWLTAIVGPSGVGKTWWLLMIALNAAMRGYNVAFFSYEMPEAEITCRVQQLITGLPKDYEENGILIPVWDCIQNQRGSCTDSRRCGRVPLMINGRVPDWEFASKNYIPCAACRGSKEWYPTTWLKQEQRDQIADSVIIEKHRALIANAGNRVGDFHVMAAPSGQMSVDDVKVYLKNREYYEGIIPDIIITDSADKMKPSGRYDEHRHGIYGIWMAHKALSEELHAAVLTASHSNTERTGKRIKQGDWAEDIRKLRECDGGWALNQNHIDKQLGRYSISTLKYRDNDFDLNKNVMVTTCLKIGRPYLDSAIERKPPKEKEEGEKVVVKRKKSEE